MTTYCPMTVHLVICGHDCPDCDNGKPPVFTYYQDPAHGWIEVPLATVDDLGIADQVSSYSYRHAGFAYLEEDCDAGAFLRAYRGRYGVDPAIREVHQDHTPIRRYAPFCERRPA